MIIDDWPSIRFFKNENSELSAAFKQFLFDFVATSLGAFEATLTYGKTSYFPPDRDNQFHDSYIRAVYHNIELEQGEKLSLHFMSEESEQADFIKKWHYSSYKLRINITTRTDWEYFKKTWFLFKPCLEEVGFKDATIESEYGSTGLYDFYKEQKKLGVTQGIKALFYQ